MRSLVLGCGHTPPTRRNIFMPGTWCKDAQVEWVTLDNNRSCQPTVVFDLNELHSLLGFLPFAREEFDEIRAFEVLEHFGRLGDYRGFFREWREYWRVLKPGGYFYGSCPETHAAWGDPGHTRVVTFAMLEHLTRGYYENLGKSHVTDYRSLVDPCWWESVAADPTGNTLVFCMRKSS